jgi:hypothetical protein
MPFVCFYTVDTDNFTFTILNYLQSYSTFVKTDLLDLVQHIGVRLTHVKKYFILPVLKNYCISKIQQLNNGFKAYISQFVNIKNF